MITAIRPATPVPTAPGTYVEWTVLYEQVTPGSTLLLA